MIRHIASKQTRALWRGKGGTSPALFSTTSKSFPTTVSDQGVATLSMSNAPVNAFNTSAFKDFTAVVKGLEEDPDVHAMVLTSSLKGVFSAGLDVTCIVGADKASYVCTNR